MYGSLHDRHRLGSLFTHRFVFGLGAITLLTTIYLLLTSTPIQTALPERLLELMLLGVPAVGLLFSGYWLHSGQFTPEQLWQIGMYSVGATLIAATSTGLAIVLVPELQVSTQAVFFLLISTSTEGALVGVLFGAFTVVDALRRRGTQLEHETTRFHSLERTADIGYWEIEAAADPGAEMVQTERLRWLHDLPDTAPFNVETGLENYHPEDHPAISAAVEQAISAGEAFDIEARVCCSDGSCRWMRTVGEPVFAGDQIVALQGMMQDITERKEYEQNLEEQNARLDEFASIVSHDLRNPLNVAQGRLELGREECETEHFEVVDRAHDRMAELIDDLLTLSRQGGERADLETVELGAVVTRCWETVATGDATLHIETRRRVQADSSRLQQLIENLLRNAIEHGGTDVAITVGDLDNGFYVADDGSGIPEADRDDVFDTGYSSTTEGTGLGLTIVKQVANTHGWSVRVTEGPDGGARFEVTGVEFERA